MDVPDLTTWPVPSQPVQLRGAVSAPWLSNLSLTDLSALEILSVQYRGTQGVQPELISVLQKVWQRDYVNIAR